MKRRLLALLLVLAMALPMVPMGALAEDAAEGTSSGTYEVSYIAGTAEQGEDIFAGVTVSANGVVVREDMRGYDHVIVVAAAYEDGQMVDSAYETATIDIDGSFAATLQLYLTAADTEIRLFPLWPDKQPVGGMFGEAKWKHSGSGIDASTNFVWQLQDGSLSLYCNYSELNNIHEHDWDPYIGEITSVTVNGATVIGDDFFRSYENLETVVLGEDLTTINYGAFWGLRNLKSVSLPSTLTYIGDSAFKGVPDDVKITVPEGFSWDDVDVAPVGNDPIWALKNGETTVSDVAANDATEPTVPETTEETVPETTEETVPETTEETVPETTVETVPETTVETVPETTVETVPETEPETTPETEPETAPDTKAAEEAAGENYYIAPLGATMKEDAALVEVAFSGTDKVAKGTHTATFTGLVPLQYYTFISSTAVDDEFLLVGLRYIDVIRADAEGTARVTYIPMFEDAAIPQLYGPEALTLTVDKDYVSLHPGESMDFQFETNDFEAELREHPYDNMPPLIFGDADDDPFRRIITVNEDHQPAKVETYYIDFVASDNRIGQSATVRVRVDVVPEEAQVTKATLGETKLTRNIYDSKDTEIPVFLDMKIPVADEVTTQSVSGIALFDAEEGTEIDEDKEETTTGRIIQDVSFTDDTAQAVKELFTLTVRDDHTLLLNTNVKKLSDAAFVKALKASYKVGIQLTINGQEEPVKAGSLTLTVQKKLPTLKAAAVTLNPYYKTSAQVTVTGGKVASLVSATDVAGLKLLESEGTLTAVMTEAPAKAATKNLVAQVEVEGYNVPVKVTVPVKLDVKAPALKLGKTAWTVSSLGAQSLEIPIQCSTKGVSLDDITFNVKVPVLESSGKESEYYTASVWGDTLYLEAKDIRDENDEDVSLPRPAGKQTLTLRLTATFQDNTYNGEDLAPITELPINFKVTVTSVDPTIKLDKSQVTLNIFVGEQALTTPTTTIPSGSVWPEYFYYHSMVEGKATGNAEDFLELNLEPLGTTGKVGINFNQSAFWDAFPTEQEQAKAVKDTYTMYIALVDKGNYQNWTKVTIRLSDGTPSLTAKVSGNLDLISDLNHITITPTYKNANGTTEYDPWGTYGLGLTIRNSQGEDCTQQFMIDDDTENGKLLLSANPANRPGVDKYTATLTLPGYMKVEGSATVTFNVTNKTKPTAKVSGKIDSLTGKSATITTTYRRQKVEYNMWNEEVYVPVAPESVTLLTTAKKPAEVSEDLYSWYPDYSDGSVKLSANTTAQHPLPAGKYTAKLTYPNGTTISAPITVTQSPVTLKLAKTSTNIHPSFTDCDSWIRVTMTNSAAYQGDEACTYEFYKSNGKTKWEDQDLIAVDFSPENGYVSVTPTGKTPDKDTTLKIKLIPDVRIPSKCTWLTVKVLGGKSLKQAVTLKAGKAIDPSYEEMTTTITYTMKGFDNRPDTGTVQLEIYNPKTKKYELEYGSDDPQMDSTVAGGVVSLQFHDKWAQEGNMLVFSPALETSRKYQARVSFGENVVGTVPVKVAYGSNKFTVAKAPTLYKEDAQEPMDIHLNAKSVAQQISYVTIKGSTNFEIISGSGSDWTLRLKDGVNVSKLKTTTLTLQIFLKGNTTGKPNATTTVKVTVK